MRKLVNEVATLIRDLETLKLVTKDSVISMLALKDGRHIFEVKFVVQLVAVEACVEMLENVKQQNNVSGSISVGEERLFGKGITATFFK